jgi:hypothetical protein
MLNINIVTNMNKTQQDIISKNNMCMNWTQHCNGAVDNVSFSFGSFKLDLLFF